MKAKVAENRANVVLAEAEVPLAMAAAFRQGNFVGREATPGNGAP
ncbi:MAG TPA: flotillin-like FloA family protein [Pirellulales bacterium]|nr:flotillin-like FloA family protein [Pirellulales bacterium]